MDRFIKKKRNATAKIIAAAAAAAVLVGSVQMSVFAETKDAGQPVSSIASSVSTDTSKVSSEVSSAANGTSAVSSEVSAENIPAQSPASSESSEVVSLQPDGAAHPSKWEAQAPVHPKATEGIDYQGKWVKDGKDKDTLLITCTIPKGMDTSEITIDPTDAICSMIFKKYMPGDMMGFRIQVVNESGKTYQYDTKSFQLSAEGKDYLTQHSTDWNIGMTNFFGEHILNDYRPSRSDNAALQALLGKTVLEDTDVTDEKIAAALKSMGYKNGVADLGSYYLSFFNKQFGTKHTALEQFKDDQIIQMFGGNYLGVRESNSAIAELGYNFFYNRLFSFYLTNGDNWTTGNYSVGSFMRNEHSNETEAACKDAFGSVQTGKNGTLCDIGLSLDGPMMNNVYQNYNFGFQLNFQLKEESTASSSSSSTSSYVLPYVPVPPTPASSSPESHGDGTSSASSGSSSATSSETPSQTSSVGSQNGNNTSSESSTSSASSTTGTISGPQHESTISGINSNGNAAGHPASTVPTAGGTGTTSAVQTGDNSRLPAAATVLAASSAAVVLLLRRKKKNL